MAEIGAQIIYNTELKELEILMDGVTRPGDFFAS